jgi:hypothetical protein
MITAVAPANVRRMGGGLNTLIHFPATQAWYPVWDLEPGSPALPNPSALACIWNLLMS